MLCLCVCVCVCVCVRTCEEMRMLKTVCQQMYRLLLQSSVCCMYSEWCDLKMQRKTYLALYGDSGTWVFASTAVSYSLALQRWRRNSQSVSVWVRGVITVSREDKRTEWTKAEVAGVKPGLSLFILAVNCSPWEPQKQQSEMTAPEP